MSKLLWCPIDLPKFPVQFNLETEKSFRFWNFVNITDRLEGHAYQKTVIRKEIAEQYPEFVNWFNLFPYKSIRNIKFNIQTSAVVPHIDFTRPEDDPELFKNNSENEPTGYRILLKGRRENCLYMSNGRHGDKFYCTMPEDTDVYVLRSTDGWHGVEDDDDRQTIYIHLEVDPTQHQELLQRSLAKYGKYAIYE